MIYFKQESYDIIGAAMHVYNELGNGFLEAVYQEALGIELSKRAIPFEREKELNISYSGQTLIQTYKADFVCYDKIIIELKAVVAIDNSHRSQVFNYLKATGSKLGILLNFGNPNRLEYERIVK